MSDVADKPNLLPVRPTPQTVLSQEERERPIWEQIEELVRDIPDEELDRIPHDGSINHDHYLYGAPKKENA